MRVWIALITKGDYVTDGTVSSVSSLEGSFRPDLPGRPHGPRGRLVQRAMGDDARGRVTDDGCPAWMCDHWPGTNAAVCGPGCCTVITNPADVAACLVDTVTQAMACLQISSQHKHLSWGRTRP